MIVLPVVAMFMRDRPEDVGERPFGADMAWVPTPGPTSMRAAIDGLRGAVATPHLLVPRGHLLHLRRDDEPASSRRT